MTIPQQIQNARAQGWLDSYFEAAAFYGIPVEILLAKDSRESWLGTYPGLQANGWIGSDGVSKGISQINSAVHPFARTADPNNVRAYIAKGAELLKDELDRFGRMRTALAAYNAGAGNVIDAIDDGQDPDSVTTNNYADDVLNRADQIRPLVGLSEITVTASALPSLKGYARKYAPAVAIAGLVGGIGYYSLNENAKVKGEK